MSNSLSNPLNLPHLNHSILSIPLSFHLNSIMLFPLIGLFLYLPFYVNTQSPNPCLFENGAIAANWSVANGIVYVEFINKNLANNQWTGLTFGDISGNLEAIIFSIRNFQASISTGVLANSGYLISEDPQPDITPIFINYNLNRLTVRFQRSLSSNGPRGFSLDNCIDWNFISASPLNPDGSIGAASQGKTMNVCPNRCNQPQNQAFMARDYYTNPVPLRALNNNRQSSRFDGLYEQNGIDLIQ